MKDFNEVRSFVYTLETLRKISRSINNLDVTYCNKGELSKRQETRLKNLIREADEIARMYGLRAYHQSDPRGCSLYILTDEILKSKQYTDGIAIF